MKSLWMSALLLTMATNVAALELDGQYQLKGANPGGSGQYTGKAAIVATGETYQVRWRIGGVEHQGTGILVKDVFSVVYQAAGSAPGIAVYQVQRDGSLKGRWASLNATGLGGETWTRDAGI
jgi:hypothetical protein